MAVFIILFFTAMAAAIVKVQTSSSDAVVVEVYSARALNVANSGAGLKIEGIFSNSLVTGNCGDLNHNTPSETWTFSGNGLANCSAGLSCVTKTSGTMTVYSIQSIGSCTFDDGSRTTSRTVMMQAKDL